MRILFLSAWFPYPTDNGSKLRIYNLLQALAQRHEVTLISFADGPDADPAHPALERLCREVRAVPVTWFDPHRWRARLGFLSLTPRSIVDTFSPQMARAIASAVREQTFDLVIASQTRMAVYRPYFRAVPALFEEVEVGVLYEEFSDAPSRPARLRAGLTWLKHRRYLRRLLRQYGAATVASEPEQRLLARLWPENGTLAVIPNCLDVAHYAGITAPAVPDTLVFTGSFSYFPNYDAMAWFLAEVWPRVLAERPQARLHITGNPAGRSLPPGANVTHLGFVDDVRPVVAAAAVSVAPILAGGGTRLKVLEAMALQTPVVATSKGAEGIAAIPGEHLLVADSAPDFAAAVLALLADTSARRAMAERAFELVQCRYDWRAVAPPFLELAELVAHA